VLPLSACSLLCFTFIVQFHMWAAFSRVQYYVSTLASHSHIFACGSISGTGSSLARSTYHVLTLSIFPAGRISHGERCAGSALHLWPHFLVLHRATARVNIEGLSPLLRWFVVLCIDDFIVQYFAEILFGSFVVISSACCTTARLLTRSVVYSRVV